jgi:hypothetical protein
LHIKSRFLAGLDLPVDGGLAGGSIGFQLFFRLLQAFFRVVDFYLCFGAFDI